MYEYGYYISNEDLNLLLNRFDKNKYGKISYRDVSLIIYFYFILVLRWAYP